MTSSLEKESYEYFRENDRCPQCKGFNTVRKPMEYDEGGFSDETEDCICNDCGKIWLLV